MKYKIKTRFKNFLTKYKITRYLLFAFRKIRLVLQSFLYLPRYVYYGDAKINTRGWQTANVEVRKIRLGLDDYEPETTEFIKKISPEVTCFWDVGAHIGYFSILVAQKGVKTYAFEIDDDFVKEIQKHRDTNNLNKIKIITKPLAQSGQSITFKNYSGIVTKNSISADEFIEKYGDIPDLIKIDIDGGERDFLLGAKKLLTKNNPKIRMELNKTQSKLQKLRVIMNNYGYKEITKLDDRGGNYYNALFTK